MKAESLVTCIMLSSFVILLLSIEAQATEYREVKAEDILDQLENGKDVYLVNCNIVGELNASKINLETVPSPSFNKLVKAGLNAETIKKEGLNEELGIIESNITIINSTFENSINFSNVNFEKYVSFKKTNFKDANFVGASYGNYANFSDVNFNNSADFSNSNFYKRANFTNSNFHELADFSNSNFYEITKFSNASFNKLADFSAVNFNKKCLFRSDEF
jgi:uncharacterized protein YjbI with pentapeptide repeats